jgi:catechol 2,3-dioxygenase-like lactoylglutathione lyase family enzyme
VNARPPFELEAIDHVLLLVDGMDSALQFYEAVLGAHVIARIPQHGMVELRAGGSSIDLVDISSQEGNWAVPAVPGGRNVDHIALRLRSFAERAARDHLAAHDVAIVEERTDGDASGKTLSLYVRDPSGNVVELIGRL